MYTNVDLYEKYQVPFSVLCFICILKIKWIFHSILQDLIGGIIIYMLKLFHYIKPLKRSTYSIKAIMMLLMYMSRQIVRGLRNNPSVVNDGIPSEVYKFASMLTRKLPTTLMHVVIILLLKCKSKDPADVNNYRPIAIATALSKVLEQVLLSRLARYL